MNLTFHEFQELNRRRCIERFHPLAAWLPDGWAVALAGEAGELCNLVKKVRRGDFTLEQARLPILKELADVITYADLMISALGADTATVLSEKFEEVSRRVGWPLCFAVPHNLCECGHQAILHKLEEAGGCIVGTCNCSEFSEVR